MKKNLERKHAEVTEKKLDLEKKIEQVMDLVKFLEENHKTMSDNSLIDNLRDLFNLVFNTNSYIKNWDHTVRYGEGGIRNGLLKSILGQTFDLDGKTIRETDLFQYGESKISVLKATDEDTCVLRLQNQVT